MCHLILYSRNCCTVRKRMVAYMYTYIYCTLCFILANRFVTCEVLRSISIAQVKIGYWNEYTLVAVSTLLKT